MKIENTCDLTAAFTALLDAAEILSRTDFADAAARTGDLAHEVMALARDAISRAIKEPGDIQQRHVVLRSAIEVDGVTSILAAQAARALAETTETALVQMAA